MHIKVGYLIQLNFTTVGYVSQGVLLSLEIYIMDILHIP